MRRLESGHDRAIAPVALFIFNRPALLARVFEQVARAKPGRLLIVADGPRPDHLADPALCSEARAIVERVDWPCEVETCFSATNMGARKRLASGLDWVFSRVPAAIVLEDDCLPDPSFFPFCSQLLERYRDDERVSMIRGGNFLFGQRPSPFSYYYSRFFLTWGWAGWARAWKYNDVEMRKWPELRESGWLESVLPRQEMVETVRGIYDETYKGVLEAWEFQWQLACWLRKAVAVAPSVNLVSNIGFAPDAAHLKNRHDPQANAKRKPVEFPLRHPERLEILDRADLREFRNIFPPHGALTRNMQRILDLDFQPIFAAICRRLGIQLG